MGKIIDLDECHAIREWLDRAPLKWDAAWGRLECDCCDQVNIDAYEPTKGHDDKCEWLLARQEAGMT